MYVCVYVEIENHSIPKNHNNATETVNHLNSILQVKLLMFMTCKMHSHIRFKVIPKVFTTMSHIHTHTRTGICLLHEAEHIHVSVKALITKIPRINFLHYTWKKLFRNPHHHLTHSQSFTHEDLISCMSMSQEANRCTYPKKKNIYS